MRLGIVDVGTNSIHLLIGRVSPDRTLSTIGYERHLPRLGDAGLVANTLSPAAMRRAMGVLRRYAAILKRRGVDRVEAVATSAVRGATNGRAFVRRVRDETGLPLRMISGEEEARLIYRGVLRTQRSRHAIVLIAVGGGSAQVICGEGTRVRYAVSLPLGGARLAQRFIHHDPPRVEEVEVLRRYTRRAWTPVVRAMRRRRWQHALGSSSMIAQLMIAAHGRTHGRPPPHCGGRLLLSQRSLRQLVRWLSTSTATERKRLGGIDPKREDLLLSTGVVLLTWMEGCEVANLRYAPGSLREGLVMDFLDETTGPR